MMKKNALSRKGIAFTVVVLFVGVSVLPATGSFLLEESLKPTEKSSVYEKSQSTSRNMDYYEYEQYQYNRDTTNRFITKERVNQIPRDPIEYEELDSSYKYSEDMDISYKGNYTPHSPIDIRGDGDFTPENGVVGGNGTIDNPYIIEGWEIITFSDTAIKVIQTSAYFIIRNCYLETGGAPKQGLRFYELQNGRADHLDISSGYEGIEIWDSSDVILSDLTISDAYNCIDIDYHSHHVTIANATLTASNTGIRPFNANYIEISNVTTQDVSVGIYQVSCNYITITDCNFYGNNRGIDIIASGYITMRNNTMHDNKQGLFIGGLIGYGDYAHDIDTSNTINGDPIYYYRNQSNLVIDGSDGIGFLGFLECDNITVKNYHTNNTGNSIIMAGTRDSQILQSSFTDNTAGLDIAYCENILISDCVADNIASPGIMFINSQHCTLRNNSIVNTPEYPFEVYGNRHQLDDFIHDIDTSNTINDEPILYLVGEKNTRITKSTEFAYLALVNCKNVRVINVNFNEYIGQGILLANTTGIVRGCTVAFNFYGIHIVHCTDLLVINCVARNCFHGFELWDSTGVKIIGCRATAGDDGFYMDTCSEMLIMGCNTFLNGFQGINLYDSWDNTIFNNRFTDTNYGGIFFKEGCHENEVCFNTITSCNFGIGIWFYDWGQNIHHNTLKRNDLTGIDLYESINNSITYNIVEGNGYYGILVAFDTGSQIDHNNIAGNDEGMVVAYCTANVSNNWWGSNDGPSGIGPGTGDLLRTTDATVYFEPWLEKAVRVKLHGLFYLLLSMLNII